MFILGQSHCISLAFDLDQRLKAESVPDLEEISDILCRHASNDLVVGVVNEALSIASNKIDQSILFRSGLVNIANGPYYSLDLRYAFKVDGEDMLPTGRGDHLLARAADVVIANIGPKSLEGLSYSIQQPVDFDRFDPLVQLELDGCWKIEPGEALAVKGGEQIASISDASGARFLSLSLLPRWSLDWVFSRETMRPIARSVAHVDDSQLMTCLEVASSLRDDMTIERVLALTGHPAHFVRWKAIQALASLRPAAALPLVIKAAAEDIHPSVREAAAATLALRRPDSLGKGQGDVSRPV